MENYATPIGMYMNLETLKSITNNNYIQEVNFNIDGSDNKQLDKSIDNINKKYDFLNITTPYNNDKNSNNHFDSRLVLGSILLVAALFNIYTTVSININNNISEFSILRAIGLKKKCLKKLVMYESLFYSFAGSIVGGTLACTKEFKSINQTKKLYAESLKVNLKTSDVYIPPKEFIIFMAVVILASILIGYLKSRSIDKIEIIEGINEN
ncbi:FtsX-like permease family protein [Romboutsia sedimentorum]|nr:FtsX-like permease family protein [Romboutsia sedimentorum]MDK2586835.1 FtsX-like permease family protein [Romboutsia sedimentorum]